MTVLVYVHAGRPAEAAVTEELVSLAASLGDPPTVIATGAAAARTAEIAAAHGAGSVERVSVPIERWETDRAARTVAAAIEASGADLLIVAERRFERDVAARVAVAQELRVLSGCVGSGDGTLRITTPSGDVGLAIDGLGPTAVTVLPWSIEPRPADASCAVIEHEASAGESASLLVAALDSDASAPPLDRAGAVVAGGRGLGSADNVRLLDELADRIPGAAVGVTAALVTDEWAPKSMLVGKTGARIAPHVYVAAGISGSFFHEANTRASHYLLAINRDEEALLSARADVCLVGDAPQLLAALTAAIAEKEGAT